MAQGVAWAAREAGVPCTVVVPEHAPQTKLDAIERLGGRTVKVPFERWWQAIEESRFDGAEGLFVHPVADERVMAGNGTIGLELLEDLPDPDTVFVPVGGGGLLERDRERRQGAAAGDARGRRRARDGRAAHGLAPRRHAEPPSSTGRRSSTAPGSKAVLAAMWPRLRELADDAVSVSLEEVAAAVRLLAERARVIAEGAGALALAAALREPGGRHVCIVSGGNIDAARLTEILAGRVPD